MLIKTRSGWMLIFAAVRRSFDETLTPSQKDTFDTFCAQKFPQGYEMSTETMGEIQTAISLMLEFCKQSDITRWKE